MTHAQDILALANKFEAMHSLTGMHSVARSLRAVVAEWKEEPRGDLRSLIRDTLADLFTEGLNLREGVTLSFTNYADRIIALLPASGEQEPSTPLVEALEGLAQVCADMESLRFGERGKEFVSFAERIRAILSSHREDSPASLREALAKIFEDVEYSQYSWDDAYDEIEKLVKPFLRVKHAPGCGYFPDESPCTCGIAALRAHEGGKP
jgi:hypothetical protein